MQNYFKLSKILKVINKLLIFALVVYCISLSTNSLIHLWNNSNYAFLQKIEDFKTFLINTYIITFVVSLFIIGFASYKYKYSIKMIYKLIILSSLLLPIAVLINYNFNLLNSFMSSFYLIVVLAVVMLSINYFTIKIDKLYKLAVEGSEIIKNRKGEKNGRKSKL